MINDTENKKSKKVSDLLEAAKKKECKCFEHVKKQQNSYFAISHRKIQRKLTFKSCKRKYGSTSGMYLHNHINIYYIYKCIKYFKQVIQCHVHTSIANCFDCGEP